MVLKPIVISYGLSMHDKHIFPAMVLFLSVVIDLR